MKNINDLKQFIVSGNLNIQQLETVYYNELITLVNNEKFIEFHKK